VEFDAGATGTDDPDEGKTVGATHLCERGVLGTVLPPSAVDAAHVDAVWT
jgi:hypothetical protein